MSVRNSIIKKLIAYPMAGWFEGIMEKQRTKKEKVIVSTAEFASTYLRTN
jgi:hypothetical protein